MFSVWVVSLALIVETLALGFALAGLGLHRFSWLPGSAEALAGSVLFGGLGGCTYCLRGVYLNACVRKSWDVSWLPWYLVRPVVSLVLGGISFLFIKSGILLFGATPQPDASPLGVWVIAFLAGLNVDRFVARIESLGHSVWGLEPSRQSRPRDHQDAGPSQ